VTVVDDVIAARAVAWCPLTGARLLVRRQVSPVHETSLAAATYDDVTGQLEALSHRLLSAP